MKTSEMIAMLEKNPKLKFKRLRWGPYNSIGIKDGVLQMIQQNGDIWTYTPICNPNTDRYEEACRQIAAGGDDWQLVREPVPGWEAIKALSEGKSIEWHSDNDREILYFNKSDKPAWAVNFNIFFTGKWYINE